MELGLITPDNLTVSADGTCVHTHANSFGHKVYNCADNGIYNCTFKRRYSDPDAFWAWDSDLNCYFYGHTHMLSYHNKHYQTDLPLHTRFLDARRHNCKYSFSVATKKRKSVPSKVPVPLHPTGVAFTLNLIEIYVFILRYQEVPMSIKRFIITTKVQNELIIKSSMIIICMI